MKITQLIKTIGVLFVLSLLAACGSHLSQQQCSNMNWHQMGLNDGQVGKSKRDLSKDIADCAKYNIDVNTTDYNRGWQHGTRRYCQPSNAYQLGVNGSEYSDVCPSNLRHAFKAAWRRGLRKYCTAKTAYNLGRSGAKMPSFCAPDQLNKFRNAYLKGHRQYRRVANIKSQMNDLYTQNDQLRRDIRFKESELATLQQEIGQANGVTHTRVSRTAPGHSVSVTTSNRASMASLLARRRELNDSIYTMRNAMMENKTQINRLQLQMNQVAN